MVKVSETVPVIFNAVQCFLSLFYIENVPVAVSSDYMSRSFIKHSSGCFQGRVSQMKLTIK